MEAYRAKRRAGELKPDPGQELAAEKLQSLNHALSGYSPAVEGGWKARFGLSRRRETPPLGLYLYGPVGRGKSMLMDLFFASVPVKAKRRVHFHAFMQEVHDRVHKLRQAGRDGDPVPAVAYDVAQDAVLLCFDEFQVDNIADAMILGRLFQKLFEHGVVVVATSNTPPNDLYREGLQRELFLPFIDLINKRLDVFDLGIGTDYRLARLKGRPVYHVPADADAEAALDDAFRDMTDGEPAPSCTLRVKGRELHVPAAAKGVARFTFDDLCGAALGAADYLTIATHFHTVVLSGIRKMPPEMRNEARRFVTLVDALYEHRVNLVCSAEAPPNELYKKGAGEFEFRRTVSRLMEMQAEDYMAQAHLT